MVSLIEQDSLKLNCAINLNRQIVGVKFLLTEKEYANANAPQVKNAIPYCVMAKLASSGKCLKACADNFKCPGGKKALGLVPIDAEALSGKRYLDLGLYQDLATARKFQEDITFLSSSIAGVMLKPLEQLDQLPDVVIIITNSYNSMRILQGYSYKYGLNKEYKLGGSQALCSEVTAYPYEKNSINISTMCSGTRFWCGWDHNDMAVGMAGNLFHDVVNGVIATMNATEPIKEKLLIDQRCKEHGLDFHLDLNNSYYYTYSEAQIDSAKKRIKRSKYI